MTGAAGGGLLWLVGLPVGLWWVVLGAGLWVAAKVSRRAVWIVTGLGAAALAALWLDLALTCGADPVYVPPTPEDEAAGGEGAMRHACDGPAGLADALFRYLVAPIALVGQALLTWWMLGRVADRVGDGVEDRAERR